MHPVEDACDQDRADNAKTNCEVERMDPTAQFVWLSVRMKQFGQSRHVRVIRAPAKMAENSKNTHVMRVAHAAVTVCPVN